MRLVELPESWRDRALVVTEVERPEEWFPGEELPVYKLEKRRVEWMLARIAAKELARRRGLCADPRAFVVERTAELSLSHCGGYGAAAIGDGPVGIDIEVRRPMNEAGAHLFLTDNEQEAVSNCTIEYPLLHFWCAKEAAWKQLGGAIPTLKKVSLRLIAQRQDGLTFDRVETFAGEVIVGFASSFSPREKVARSAG